EERPRTVVLDGAGEHARAGSDERDRHRLTGDGGDLLAFVANGAVRPARGSGVLLGHAWPCTTPGPLVAPLASGVTISARDSKGCGGARFRAMSDTPSRPDAPDEDFASILAAFEREQGGGPAGKKRKGPQPGDTVRGRVVSIGAEFAFIDLGGKAEGSL